MSDKEPPNYREVEFRDCSTCMNVNTIDDDELGRPRYECAQHKCCVREDYICDDYIQDVWS